MVTRKLHFENPKQLTQLYCSREENLRMIESHLSVRIITRDGWLQVDGEEEAIEKVEAIMILLQDARSQGLKIRNPDFKNCLLYTSPSPRD